MPLVEYSKDGFKVMLEEGSPGEDRAIKNGFTAAAPAEIPPLPKKAAAKAPATPAEQPTTTPAADAADKADKPASDAAK